MMINIEDFIDDMKEISCVAGPPMTGKTHFSALKVRSMIDKGWNPEKFVVVSLSNDVVHNCYNVFKAVLGDTVKKIWFTTISSFYNDVLGDMIETCEIVSEKDKKIYYNTKGRDLATMHTVARKNINENETAKNMLEQAIDLLVIDSAQYISHEDWMTLVNIKTGSARKIVTYGTILGQFPMKGNLLYIHESRMNVYKSTMAYYVSKECLHLAKNILIKWNALFRKPDMLWHNVDKDTIPEKGTIHTIHDYADHINEKTIKRTNLYKAVIKELEKAEYPGRIAVVSSDFAVLREKEGTIWYRLMLALSRENIKVTDRTEKLGSLENLAYRIVVTRRISSGVKNITSDDIHEAAILLSIKNHRNMTDEEILKKIMNTKRVKETKTAAELADKLLSTSRYPKWIKNRKETMMSMVAKMKQDFYVKRNQPGGIEFVLSNCMKWNNYDTIFLLGVSENVLDDITGSRRNDDIGEMMDPTEAENIIPINISSSLVNIICRARKSFYLHSYDPAILSKFISVSGLTIQKEE